MAEIKVERKKQAPVWPWIIGILVLLGLIWFLVEAFNEDSEVENEYRETEVEIEEETSYVPASGENDVYLSLNSFQKPKQAVL